MTPRRDRPHARAVRREYERLASTYDRIWSRYLARSIELTLDNVRADPVSQILDVGCGTGLLLDRLSHVHPEARLTGIDLTPAMLALAQRRVPGRASLVLGDAATLPFPDGTFDIVVSTSVLHYLPEPLQALAEWRRVLLPGGTLLVTDWCRDFVTIRALDLVLRGIDPAHSRTWNASELRGALVAAGFSGVNVSRRRCGWFWGMMVATASRNTSWRRRRAIHPRILPA